MPIARLTEPLATKRRNWRYNPETGTFTDLDTNEEVDADGAPVRRGPQAVLPEDYNPIEAIDTPGEPLFRRAAPEEPQEPFVPQQRNTPQIVSHVPVETLYLTKQYGPPDSPPGNRRPAPDPYTVSDSGKIQPQPLKPLEGYDLLRDPLGAYERNVAAPAAGALEVIGQTAGGANFNYSPAATEIGERIREKNPQTPEEALAALYQATGEYERERPEGFAGEKFILEMIADPANLIGIGLEPRIARGVMAAAKKTGGFAGRAIEDIAQATKDIPFGQSIKDVGGDGQVIGDRWTRH